jgi:hypothetical protein
MPSTIPTFWTLQEEREIQPARPIVATGVHDLLTLNQRVSKAMACHTRILAGGGLGMEGDERYHDEEGVTPFTRRYIGACHLWRDPVRCRLVAYGQNVDLRIVLGGVTVTTLTLGGTAAWYASSDVDVSGMTRSSGVAQVEVLAQEAVAIGTRRWFFWVLEERPMTVLPAYGDDDTEYAAIDDSAFLADQPLDGWLLASLARNIDEVLRWRTRGTAMVWPSLETVYVSSAFWRSDGPYLLMADPWVDRASVAVNVVAIDVDVEVTAFSEWETQTVAKLRAQTVVAGAAAVTLKFSGLRVREGQQNRIWVGFRGGVGDPVAYTGVLVNDWAATGARTVKIVDLGSGLASTEPVDWPVGRYVRAVQTGLEAIEAIELAQDQVSGQFDLAWLRSPPDDYEARIRVAGNVRDAQRPDESMPLDVREVGVLGIRSVSIVGARGEGAMSAADLWAAASVGVTPPWTVPTAVASLVNTVTRYGTPQVAMRQRGQRYLHGSRTEGALTYYQRGRYAFCPGQALEVVERFAWPSSPALGGGLDPQKIRATIVYALVDAETPSGDVSLTWKLWDATAGAVLASAVDTNPADGATAETTSLSLWDASMAAIAAGWEDGEIFEHNYVQQLGCFPEEFAVGGERPPVWRQFVLEGELPASGSRFIDLKVGSTDASVWVVVVGVAIEVLERG